MPDFGADLVADIRKASRLLVREFGFLDKTLAGTDLSASSVHTVVELGLSGELSAKELGERLKLEKSTVSRMVHSLEKRGEISSRRLASDRRASRLALTDKGRQTFVEITQFAENQVRNGLAKLDGITPEAVSGALNAYATALSGERSGGGHNSAHKPEVVEGYQTGMIGDIAALHARTHGPIVGMGPAFEIVVAKAMADFVPRLESPANNSWSVMLDDQIVASITIDGEDLGGNIAHLRWFILADRLRGQGLGRILLTKALAHCDRLEFDEIHLWTLQGLEPARRLYERNGFELVEEYQGDQWGKAVMEQKFVRKCFVPAAN